MDYATANYSTQLTSLTVSSLPDGQVYRFAVRASDAWGNQDGNLVERTAIPTTPVDTTPPNFAGLQTASDAGIGGGVALAWPAASDPDTPASNSDPSIPIQYLAYATPSGIPFDFGTPALTTLGTSGQITGLVDGTEYLFIVRAVDAQGNAETNSVIRRAVPTHPYDSTPPSFAGVANVTDMGTGSLLRVTWGVATDPDTPESGVDPSLPITYLVFVSTNASSLGTGAPLVSTTNLSVDIGDLQPGQTYYVLVRARDSAGNVDSNARIVAIKIAPPPALGIPWWWIVLLVLALAILLALFAIWRRRRRETGPAQPPPGAPPT